MSAAHARNALRVASESESEGESGAPRARGVGAAREGEYERRVASGAACWVIYRCVSLMSVFAALPATTQLAEPATTASSSNQRKPKSSMHSGKSGLMMM